MQKISTARAAITSPRAGHILLREPFRTSRLLDFCTEPELVKQIGHPAERWPLVVLKELTDNALDEAEEAGTAPEIHVEVRGNDIIIITDDGRGIPAETVAGMLDFSVPTANSRSRRAQGLSRLAGPGLFA